MSVTRTEVGWTLLGEIPTGQQALNSLRILTLSSNDSGVISYTSNNNYKVFYFSLSGSSLASNNSKTYTIPFSGSTTAFPIGGYGQNFAWFFSGKINRYDHPNLYTIEQETTGNPQLSLHGFDAIERDNGAVGYLAYSMQEIGGIFEYNYNNSLLIWGRPSDAELSPRTSVNVGFTGNVRLSRNGLICCVFGDYNSVKTIRVYSGEFTNANSTSAVKLGGDIVVPGNSLSDVRINNTGTRLLATTLTLIYYYELVASQWVLQSTVAIPLEANEFLQGISINADSSILIASSNTVLYTYTLSGGAWFLVAQMGASISNTFYGAQIDIAQNSVFLAAANGQTGTNIYRSTITEVTYDAPVITPGQSFTLAETNAFSGALAMLNDGLNRQVTSWSATGLPTGLSINATTGQITGTPTAKGQFTASITASNPDGSDTESVTFSVVDNFPLYAGATRATAVYAGATAAKAIYYGPSLLWNVAGWEPSTLQNNLLVFYRLNDAGGGVLSLADSSGNNRTLTNTGGVLLGTGVISGAASFQSPRWLSVALPFNTAQPWAISFWANISNLKNYFTLIGGESTGRLHIHGDSSGRLYLNNGFSDGVSVPNFFTEGQWAHYAFSRSGSTLSVYKNYELINTYNLTASYTQTSTLYIGRVIFTPDDFQFVGRMDAIGLWSRAITSAEVSQLYNNGAGLEI